MLSNIPLPDDEKLVLLPGVALVLLHIAEVNILFGFQVVFLGYILTLAFLYQSRNILRDKESFIDGENISEEARSIYNADFEEDTKLVFLFFCISAGVFTLFEIYLAYTLFANLSQFNQLSTQLPAYATITGLLLHLFSDLSIVSFIFAIAFNDKEELDKWRRIRNDFIPYFYSDASDENQ